MSRDGSFWEKYKALLNKEIHLLPHPERVEGSCAELAGKEAEEEDRSSAKPEEGKRDTKKRQILQNILLVAGVVLLMAIAAVGGYFAVDSYLAHASGPRSSEQEQDEYGDWQVYQNESHHFEIRYPINWEVKEIKAGRIRFRFQREAADEKPPKDYIFVRVTSSKGRSKNACEKNYEKCSFYANGIFGERSVTPETDEIFFGHGKKDFTLTLCKFDSDEETIGSYVEIFEKLAGSFKFLGEATKACKEVADCVLAIRVDKCCSCPEVVSQTELKANLSLVAWEANKDLSSQRLLDCTSVYCNECPQPSPFGVKCVENLCTVE
jgi:hypothetical protein